jgi:hypothetical protein
VLKEYERYARGLSSLSKEPAMQVAHLGLEYLTITAGYADPVRLEWAVVTSCRAERVSEVSDVGTGISRPCRWIDSMSRVSDDARPRPTPAGG